MDRADIRRLRAGSSILNLAGGMDERRILAVKPLPIGASGREAALVTVEYGKSWLRTRVEEGGPEMLSDTAGDVNSYL